MPAATRFITSLSPSLWYVWFLLYSMQQSPSWEANRFSGSYEIPRIFCIPKVHYRFYKSPLPIPIPSQINPVHAPHPTSRSSNLVLYFHLRLSLPSGLFPSDFPTKNLYAPRLSHIHDTSPAHLILLQFITPINIWWGVKIIRSLTV